MARRQMAPDAITLPDPENAVRALADISQPQRAAGCGSGMLWERPIGREPVGHKPVTARRMLWERPIGREPVGPKPLTAHGVLDTEQSRRANTPRLRLLSGE